LYSKPYNPGEDFEFPRKEIDYAKSIDNLSISHSIDVEAFKVWDVGKDSLPKFTMPHIESRIITSEQTHQRLIEAQQGYALKKARFWKEMRDEFWQRNEYNFLFQPVGLDQPYIHMHFLSNALVESMEVYVRSAWNLSDENGIDILLGDNNFNKLDSWRTIRDAARMYPDCDLSGGYEPGPHIYYRYVDVCLRVSVDGKMDFDTPLRWCAEFAQSRVECPAIFHLVRDIYQYAAAHIISSLSIFNFLVLATPFLQSALMIFFESFMFGFSGLTGSQVRIAVLYMLHASQG
jgi:hypothetical protein